MCECPGKISCLLRLIASTACRNWLRDHTKEPSPGNGLGRAGRQRVLVSAARYVPERGDLLWLTFDPQAGHEQAGRRPALVLSPAAYNRRARLALVCPITTQAMGYPFEVALPTGLPLS